MKLDLTSVPFSRYGSYLACSILPPNSNQSEGLYLRSVHGGIGTFNGTVIRLDLLVDKTPQPAQVEADAVVLQLSLEDHSVKLCFPHENELRMRGESAGLRLSFQPGVYDYIFPAGEHRWQVNCASWDVNLMLTILSGSLRVDAPWQITRAAHVIIDLLPGPDGVCEMVLEEIQGSWHPNNYTQSFAEAESFVRQDFQHWLEMTVPVPEKYATARELAAYINWCSVVEPLGHLNWPAMLMSKNWMCNVWSWDHCFNAMALTYRKAALGWDQIRVIFDQQDMYGQLPDCINDRRIITSYVKPPIHGLTLAWMMDRTSYIRKEQLQTIYGPLCRWTEWWFTYRDYDGDGIPQYHHGNDSGWDNCSIFEIGMPVETPDLCAFLIIQMEVLGKIASRLGYPEEAESWQRRSENLLEKMLAHFWQGDHFVALRSGDHLVSDTDSLFLFLPLILGKRLPAPVRNELIAGLMRESRFLTQYGLATESPESPRYEPDGYWRGPIWAPSTWLIVEGLAACGEEKLARDIAMRFCDMAARHGFAENFNALTGEALRDRAYTWTSSIFLLLAHEYGGETE